MTREVINELKKYTMGKKNTEKIEISVLALNRLIFALEQESCEDCPVLDKIVDTISEYKSRKVFGVGIADLEMGKQTALDYVLAIIDQCRPESEG